ncbi:response regulator [Desulfococcus sp.]|uniref:response regulator n=1 Tax=Desulfococcus sp. TaxID=2025834 RepID=UPI0035942567
MLNILVVDADAQTPPDTLSRIMEGNGHRIRVARSGKEAMNCFLGDEYDVVLLDMFLPDCMGYDLIPEFRKKKSDIRIISMTVFNTREIERKNRLLGITYYMSKPYSFNEISSLIDHISEQIKKEASSNSMMLNQLKGA